MNNLKNNKINSPLAEAGRDPAITEKKTLDRGWMSHTKCFDTQL